MFPLFSLFFMFRKEDKTLEKYLQEIGEYPLLTAQEEIELAKRAKQNDQEAMNTLTKSNLRFVVSVAKNYQGQGLPLKDLIQDGNIGLIKAVPRFDETKGFKFISYAVWWIRQSILQSLAETSNITKLPLNKVSALNKAKKVYNSLANSLESEYIPIEDLAEATGVSEKELTEAFKYSKKSLSLDYPIPGDTNDKNRLSDALIVNDPAYRNQGIARTEYDSLKKEIDMTLKEMHPRDAEFLKRYFGIDRKRETLDSIGDQFGLTRERVRQIKETAFKTLKGPAGKRLRELMQYSL